MQNVIEAAKALLTAIKANEESCVAARIDTTGAYVLQVNIADEMEDLQNAIDNYEDEEPSAFGFGMEDIYEYLEENDIASDRITKEDGKIIFDTMLSKIDISFGVDYYMFETFVVDYLNGTGHFAK